MRNYRFPTKLKIQIAKTLHREILESRISICSLFILQSFRCSSISLFIQVHILHHIAKSGQVTDILQSNANIYKLNYFDFGVLQKRPDLEDLEECCTMSIDLHKSASKQPRTSLAKFLFRWGDRSRSCTRHAATPLAELDADEAAFCVGRIGMLMATSDKMLLKTVIHDKPYSLEASIKR